MQEQRSKREQHGHTKQKIEFQYSNRKSTSKSSDPLDEYEPFGTKRRTPVDQYEEEQNGLDDEFDQWEDK